MHYIKYTFVALTIIAIIYIAYNINLLGNKIDALNTKVDGNWVGQDERLNELTKATNILIEDAKLKWSVMQDSGLVIGVKDGQPVPNPLLLKAWNQANQIP